MQDLPPEAISEALASLLPDEDRSVLADGAFARDLHDFFAEGVRDGVDGWLDDDLAFTRPWGFELSEIAVPTSLWQGSVDLMVPLAHGRWIARAAPGVAAHLLEGEGHLSIVSHHSGAILDELLASAGRR